MGEWFTQAIREGSSAHEVSEKMREPIAYLHGIETKASAHTKRVALGCICDTAVLEEESHEAAEKLLERGGFRRPRWIALIPESNRPKWPSSFALLMPWTDRLRLMVGLKPKDHPEAFIIQIAGNNELKLELFRVLHLVQAHMPGADVPAMLHIALKVYGTLIAEHNDGCKIVVGNPETDEGPRGELQLFPPPKIAKKIAKAQARQRKRALGGLRPDSGGSSDGS